MGDKRSHRPRAARHTDEVARDERRRTSHRIKSPVKPAVDVNGYCQDKLSNEDVAQYYSLLFLPAAQRRAGTALYALWLELREINYECADPMIARAKLAWWYDELNEMYRGRPRHPVAQAMAPIIARYGLPEQEFIALLAAQEKHIGIAGYPTYNALREHGVHTRGRIDSLAARVTGHPGADLPAHTADVGATLELVALLQHVGVDARRGRVYLPRMDMEHFGVDANDLHADECRESARMLVKHCADRLHDELTQHAATSSRHKPQLLCSSRIAAAIALALLAKVRARPERVLHERPRLMPLRLLWIAWCTARRERQPAPP